MYYGKRPIACVLVLGCIFPALCLAQNPSPTVKTLSNEEDALTALITKYYSLYANKDLEGLLKLWSAKSTGSASSGKILQGFFANHDRVQINSLLLRDAKIDGSEANCRIDVDISAVDVRTGKPATDVGKMHRVFRFVKEEGAWKIAQDVDAEEDLARAVAALPTEAERRALLEREKELDSAQLSRALVMQADGLRVRGNNQQALAVLATTRTFAEGLKDKAGLALVLNATGIVHYYQGGYDSAMKYWQESLALYAELNNKSGQANLLNNFGNLYRSRGDYSAALESYKKSLALRDEGTEKTAISDATRNIGVLYTELGDYDLALSAYQRSLALKNAIGEKSGPGFVRLLNSFGAVYFLRGDYSNALEYWQKSLALAQTSADKAGISAQMGNMGALYYKQGDYQQALEGFQKSLALDRELEDKQGTADELHNVASVFESLGDYAKAMEYLQESLALEKTIGNEAQAASAMGGIGNLFRLQGDYRQADDYLRQSHAISLRLGNKTMQCRALINIARVQLSQKDYSAALESLDRAAGLAGQTGEREALWEARALEGEAYLRSGQAAKARKTLDDSIATIESLRADVAGGEQEQQSSFEAKVSPYHLMVELLAAEGHAEEALTYAERAKARTLLDVLLSGHVRVSKTITAEEREQETGLTRRLVSLNAQIARESSGPQPDNNRLADLKVRLQKARLDHEAFQTKLYADHPELKVKRGAVQELSLREAADLVPNTETTMVEYTVTDEKTYILVLTRNGDDARTELSLTLYKVPIKRAELGKLAESFRGSIAARDLDFRQLGRRLYDLLLRPALAQIQGKATLVIVPDAELWQLPFQGLLSAPNRVSD